MDGIFFLANISTMPSRVKSTVVGHLTVMALFLEINEYKEIPMLCLSLMNIFIFLVLSCFGCNQYFSNHYIL